MNSIVWIPALPLLAFLINGLFGAFYPKRWAGWLSVLAVVGSFVLALQALFGVLDHHGHGAYFYGTVYQWISSGGFRVTVGDRRSTSTPPATWRPTPATGGSSAICRCSRSRC
jgi:NADH:ubiquinone oxidoreductase subunit 5 (subunit L)/multisubunit Na+/H+ antiporter MnhA subunit